MKERFTKECLAATQTLLDLKGSIWASGISAGCYITPQGKRENGTSYGGGKDGDTPYGLTGCVCHHFMLRYKGFKEPFLFVNVMKRSKLLKAQRDDGSAEAFVRFMCQESPVRNFIVNRDNLEELMDGGVVIDCLAAGYPVTVWIAKTLRIIYEETYRLTFWNEMVKRGAHPMLALCYAMCVTQRKTKMTSHTHNSTMVPCSANNIKQLLVDHLPAADYWGDTDSVVTSKVFAPDLKGGDYNCPYPAETILPVNVHGGGKVVKVADGWGGYTEKVVGGGDDDIADELIKLEKEYK